MSQARRSLAACLVSFLLGSVLAPHRHANGLADLLADAPSNSGIFLDVTPTAARGAPPLAESARWVDDDPCLACFPSDFVARETSRSTPLATLALLGLVPPVLFEGDISLAVPLLGSRSPPPI